jgi:hypothetical protein
VNRKESDHARVLLEVHRTGLRLLRQLQLTLHPALAAAA